MKTLPLFSGQVALRLRLGCCAAILVAAFSACAPSTETPLEPDHKYPVTFDLASVVSGIPTDSMSVTIRINDGEPQIIVVNFKTGESTTRIAAKPGDTFQLHYEIFSGGVRIGSGLLRGDLKADLAQTLEPSYDSAAIAQVKRSLTEAQLLPANLFDRYALAIVDIPLSLRLDSVSGVRYTWALTPQGSATVTSEGQVFSWTPSSDLIGKSIPVKVEAWRGATRAEVRNGNILVLAKAPDGRLLRLTTRSDTSARKGTLTRLSHSDGLTLRQTFADLDPARDAIPIAVDSVQLDNFNRPLLIRSALSSGETMDSAFTWSSSGHLLSLKVRQGPSILADSFTWVENAVRETRHFQNDSLIERLVHHRDQDSGSDTLFTLADNGKWEITRLFKVRYVGDKIVEKTWYLLRNGWQANRRETFVYTGLGALLRYQRYREGEKSEPENSEWWTFSDAGLPTRRMGRDDKTGEIELVQDFTWESTLAKRSMSGSVSAPTGRTIPSHASVGNALSTLAQFHRDQAELSVKLPRPANSKNPFTLPAWLWNR